MKILSSFTITFLLLISAATALEIENTGVTDITRVSATLAGELVSTNETDPVLTVFYGTSDGGTTTTSWAASNVYGQASTGAVSTNITGLTPAQAYYYRWFADDGETTAWASATSNFWTLAGAPTSTPAMTAHAVMVDPDGDLLAPADFFTRHLGTMAFAATDNYYTATETQVLLAEKVGTDDPIYLAALTNISEIVLTNAWGWEKDGDHQIKILIDTNHPLESITGLQAALDAKANTGTVAGISGRVDLLAAESNLWATVAQSMTNFTHVASSTNWLAYDPATRTLSGCVTNLGAGGAAEAPWNVAPTNGTWGTDGQVPRTDGGSNWYWSTPFEDSPYQPCTSTNVAADGTNTITFASGGLVKIVVAAPGTTITFDNTNFPTNGVNRVGIELWAGTNSVAFDTTKITNAVAPTVHTDDWTSLFFRRVKSGLWKGRSGD